MKCSKILMKMEMKKVMFKIFSFSFVLLIVVPVVMVGLIMMLNEASDSKGKK